MIHKVYPSLNDFENLSRLKVEASDFANTFDYRNVVVNKPWGYEYLWFQNEKVAIWFLYIKKENGTSLHCHARKRTSLIVLDGEVQCTTLDDKYRMKTLEAIVLEPCVFHSTKAFSDSGAFIMEIETPPMKGDLVRMNDAYGRQGTGYEKTNEYSTEFSQFEFFPFEEKDFSGWKFRNLEIKLSEHQAIKETNTQLVVPISGYARAGEKIAIECGEAVPSQAEMDWKSIQNPDYEFLIFNALNTIHD
jgi:mannose-6-phosphate isomerase-like protein (cupin superfamily)